VNHVLAGYFAKLVNTFLSNKRDDFLSFVYQRPEVLPAFATHVYNRSIAENLVKLMQDDSHNELPFDVYLDKKRQVFKKLLDMFLKGSDNNELYLNLSMIFKDLSQHKQNYDILMEEGNLKTLLSCAGPDQPDKKVAAAANVLQFLVRNLREKIGVDKRPTTERSFFD
jgi:hypothetical protein